MAALTSLAWAGLAIAAGGAALQYSQGRKAADASRDSEREARRARSEQSASQSLQAEQERRNQIREERVRRSQIINQAAQTGTGGSSGESGALGALSTNLGSNIGFNEAMIQSGQRITGFNQASANFASSAQSAQNKGAMWGQVSNVGSTMFSNAGGFKTIFK